MFDMTVEAHWEREEAVTSHLASQLSLGRLALFLGSGVSKAFKLPTWDELIEALCQAVSRPFPPAGYPTKVTPLNVAEVIRHEDFRGNLPGFLDAVYSALYKNGDVSIENLSSNKCFAAIGAIATSSARGGVSTFITLNYDDCLENYLEALGFVVDSVSNPVHWSSRADLSIFHPHGFLPFDKTKGRSADIIFDQSSFSDVIGNKDSVWFQRIVNILRTSTVIMIGLGPNDPNLLSMLKYASSSHPRGALRYNAVSLQVDPEPYHSGTFKTHGCKVFTMRDYSDHLPSFLFQICQKAAKQRKSELGV